MCGEFHCEKDFLGLRRGAGLSSAAYRGPVIGAVERGLIRTGIAAGNNFNFVQAPVRRERAMNYHDL